VTELGGAKVLVVEDEYFIAQDLQSALEDAGAQVIGPVGDVASAFELVKSDRVDFAVLDLNLHGVVNFALAEEMTKRGIPFVFATGYEPTAVPTTYDHVPIWRKPFNTHELVAALGRPADDH
jgi:DNA-binding NtrC family response regulator